MRTRNNNPMLPVRSRPVASGKPRRVQRILLFILPVAVATSLIVFSCTKEEAADLTDEAVNFVLYENTAFSEGHDPGILGNPVSRVEIVGNNLELETLVARLDERDIGLDNVNIYGVKKFVFTTTDVVMYTLPRIYSEDFIVGYAYEDLFQVAFAGMEELDGEMTRFSLRTPDERLFYSLKLNSQDQVGALAVGDNPEIDRFSEDVHHLQVAKNPRAGEVMKQKEPTCCRQMADTGECFDCTVEYFSDKWYSLVAISLFGKEFLAGIAVSCIGAGPDARC